MGDSFEEKKDGGDEFVDEENMVFSASLDNTIRCWDDYDIRERFVLREANESVEISCLLSLPQMNLLVTGNDDGASAGGTRTPGSWQPATTPTP